KTALVLTVLVWARRKLPLLRPDRLMEIGWPVLLPAVVAQDLLVSLVVVWKGSAVLVGIVFWGLAVVAVTAGTAVFVVASMARATDALAASFIAVGVMILLLGQSYLGIITILMMVMEMAVMAVYMVMFMGMNPALMPMDMTHGKKTAIGTSVGVFVLLAAGALL